MIEIILTVMLTWTAPTTRVDGSPLPVEEIGGYTVRVECPGEDRKEYDADRSATSMEVPGTRDCDYWIATYDTDGLYSVFSKGTINKLNAPSRGGIR